MHIEILNHINLISETSSEDSNQMQKGFTSLENIIPNDLFDVIGKKGHRYHDNLTKLSLYCALKILPEKEIAQINKSKLGVIMATRYGNFIQGYKINEHSISHQTPFSAQLFPNGTFSSTAVTISIALAAQGMNLTVDSGDLGMFAAIKIASQYISADTITHCLLISGDDYHPFTAKHYENQYGSPLKLLSGVNAILIKKSSSCSTSEIILTKILNHESLLNPYLNKQLSPEWKDQYFVDVADNTNDTSNTEKQLISRGVLTAIYQYKKVKEKNLKNYKGCILVTKSVDNKIGVCVINFNN